MKKRVYLAGPFFSKTQIEQVERLEKALADHPQIGDVFSPRKHQHEEYEMFTPEWQKVTFASDVKAIDEADVIVALSDFDGADTDSGTAWELGYAYLKQIPVVTIKEDNEVLNLMLAKSLTAYLHKVEDVLDYDFDQMPEKPYDGSVI
ncbi:nucleoside 2-deoxyribosyltransferase [Fructobacillus sp. M1-13]|uniref:Nucleoside 2-deoxyribosyltransferase n=1 Tax=Fructobacillus papyriferae TaxID=2713171 RepID=A0ABS5QQR2_9LACO|nr:nucleoside 2-deoxyribosyltransferase [Fructobacillus papyriferae]MBS9334741.1 nucleoside 2-deoxyribosyltransferase [Fructobacillus papyriferae]MCD2158731.1 nucleoside 2-deoxyribosyltransferase [Fructobacillus papyriferae]